MQRRSIRAGESFNAFAKKEVADFNAIFHQVPRATHTHDSLPRHANNPPPTAQTVAQLRPITISSAAAGSLGRALRGHARGAGCGR
jgi:hypothetical protein